jgi:ornithine cyclodeaminase
LRFIDIREALGVLNFPDLVDHLERSHKKAPAQRDDLLMHDATAAAQTDAFLLRAAWQPGVALGAKLVTVLPRNQPSINALYVIFDGASGKPRACIDGDALTWYKTAADSALGARFLARGDVQQLSMIGAGTMAPYLVLAHLAERPSLQRVCIWNRTAAKAQQLMESLQAENIAAETVATLQEAVESADVLCSATMTQAPIIDGNWLQAGTHVDLVGSFTRDMREVDNTAIQRSRVYVDCRGTAVDDVGEIAIPIRDGVLQREDVAGDLYELCSGERTGRASHEEITLFKNAGGGHLDLMTAQFISERVDA